MAQRNMKGDLCMLSSLGWIDENGEPDNATITADVLSLEPAVYTQLSGDEIGACAAERMAKWARYFPNRTNLGLPTLTFLRAAPRTSTPSGAPPR